MKILGIGICLAIMLGAILQIGHHLFIDINSALFVLGGATGFLVMKNNPENHIKNFGQGDVDKMGPALAVAMLTILYGYIIKLVTIALTKD